MIKNKAAKGKASTKDNWLASKGLCHEMGWLFLLMLCCTIDKDSSYLRFPRAKIRSIEKTWFIM